MMNKQVTQLSRVILFSCLILLPIMTIAQPLVIDEFDYSNDTAARAVWAAAGSSPVVMAASGEWGDTRAMVLPIQYTDDVTRRYWDGSVSLDLSNESMFAMRVYVENSIPISYFTLYFHSGDAWMANSVTVSATGWQVWQFQKSQFRIEGETFDWSTVDRIRLSPWKQATGECYLALDQMYAYTPEICIVHGNLSNSEYSADTYAGIMEDVLDYWQLPKSVVTDTEVETGGLSGAKVAIFPYSDNMSETEIDQVEAFIDAGGKAMVFFVCPARLASKLGFERGQYTQQTYPGQFSAYRFNAPDIVGLPELVMQYSWNIYTADPVTSDARVIAYWEDAIGSQQVHPAWLASSSGTFMSHVLITDDLPNKRQTMLALLGHYWPDAWKHAAESALDNLGKVGDFLDYDKAVAWIRQAAASSPRAATVENWLAQAEQLRGQALEADAVDNYQDVVTYAMQAQDRLVQGYLDCQTPRAGEFRAFWEHAGTGAYAGDWEKSIKNLKENGFTAIIPNMLWGGSAHYNSSLLAHSSEYDAYGDQIEQCVTAAHKQGIEVHVWKVNWNFSTRAPQDWVDSMRAANRTQVSVSGEDYNWLCPSHPDNLALERDSMLEVVQNYDVDGIHFDYIRYPDQSCCYCDGCRQRFEQQTGLTVSDWPLECYSGALSSQYRQWRMDQITNLVRAVSEGAHALRSDVKISAAVFSGYPDCKQSVAQDWVHWIDEGLLDFVCPMDYTSDFQRFELIVSTQQGYVQDRIPMYPGIGAMSSSSYLGSDGVVAQILTARRLGVPGFVIFNYNLTAAEDLLPDLARGITAEIEPSYLTTY